MEQNLQLWNQNKIEKKDCKILKEESNNWSNILLGNQFLKIYFYKLGISNSLLVNRIVKIEDFELKSNFEKLQFVIVRSTYNKKNIKYDNQNSQNYYHSRLDYSTFEKTFLENNLLFFVSLIIINLII
jgi:hypothetical protein